MMTFNNAGREPWHWVAVGAVLFSVGCFVDTPLPPVGPPVVPELAVAGAILQPTQVSEACRPLTKTRFDRWGRPRAAERYVYDERGRLASKEVDPRGRGEFEPLVVYEYDEADRLAAEMRYKQGRFSEECFRFEYAYDTQGRLAETTEYRHCRHTRYGVRERRIREYQADRVVITAERYDPYTTTLTYLGIGRRETRYHDGSWEIEDFGEEDSTPLVIRVSVGEDGREVRWERSAAGEVEQWVDTAYDASGRLMRVEGVVRAPCRGPGFCSVSEMRDIHWWRPENDFFERSGVEAPRRPFGDFRIDYTYSPDGLTSTLRIDLANDGTQDAQERFVRGSRGAVESWSFDEDADGAFELEVALRYDSAGRVVSVQETALPAPSVDSPTTVVRRYTYDARGNRLTAETDAGDNRLYEEREVYAYDCPPGANECENDTECVAEEGCSAFCSPDGICAQQCHAPLRPTLRGCEEATYDTVPGEACGTCGGRWVMGPEGCSDMLVCEGAREPNRCGGCEGMQVLDGFRHGEHFGFPEPGALCVDRSGDTVEGFFFYCAEPNRLLCTPDPAARDNACLFDDELPYNAGDRCGDHPYCYYACQPTPSGDGLECACD